MGSETSFRHLGPLFFGTPADSLEIHTLKAGGWSIRRTDLQASESGRGRSRILGLEILDSLRSAEVLDERLDDLNSQDVRGCYLAISDRSSVPLVERAISQRRVGRSILYGIDPDYYFGLVPLSGENHRRVESFVLGLKPARGARARVQRAIKHFLILVGKSKRLYEAFVIVLETR